MYKDIFDCYKNPSPAKMRAFCFLRSFAYVHKAIDYGITTYNDQSFTFTVWLPNRLKIRFTSQYAYAETPVAKFPRRRWRMNINKIDGIEFYD